MPKSSRNTAGSSPMGKCVAIGFVLSVGISMLACLFQTYMMSSEFLPLESLSICTIIIHWISAAFGVAVFGKICRTKLLPGAALVAGLYSLLWASVSIFAFQGQMGSAISFLISVITGAGTGLLLNIKPRKMKKYKLPSV